MKESIINIAHKESKVNGKITLRDGFFAKGEENLIKIAYFFKKTLTVGILCAKFYVEIVFKSKFVYSEVLLWQRY
jgi:hypothetical protein